MNTTNTRESSLKQLRRKMGITQMEFAYLLKISLSGYVNYEKGTRKMPYNVAHQASMAAKKLNVKVDPAYLTPIKKEPRISRNISQIRKTALKK